MSMHEQRSDPMFLPTEDALLLLNVIRTVSEDFVDDKGRPIDHERVLAALPTGDELYTDKPAAVWSRPVHPVSMPLGRLGVVISIDKNTK